MIKSHMMCAHMRHDEKHNMKWFNGMEYEWSRILVNVIGQAERVCTTKELKPLPLSPVYIRCALTNIQNSVL